MDKPLSKILIITILVGGIIGGAAAMKIHGQSKQPSDIPVLLAAQPTPTPKSSSITDSSVTSSDGTITLTMKIASGDNGGKIYNFLISDTNGQRSIFTKNTDSTESFSLPPNAFSPDNKYIFLKDSIGSQNNYLVMTVSGSQIAQNLQTIEISGLFANKEPNFKITDVTGWAAPTLIVVNSVKDGTSSVESFWFDLSNQSFIPLATYFH